MGHLMNTEFVHWKGQSYKIKERDKVDMDRIMSNYRPFAVKKTTPAGPTTVVGPAPETKVKLMSPPKPKAKAKKPKN